MSKRDMAGRGRGRGQLTFNAELLGIGRGDAPQVLFVHSHSAFPVGSPNIVQVVQVIFCLFSTPVRPRATAQVPLAPTADPAACR